MRDIERLSRESARNLYGSNTVDGLNQGVSGLHSDSQMPGVNPKTTSTSVVERDRINLRLANALRIITAQNTFDIPFLFRSEAAALAGVKGAATLLAAEKEAQRVNIIRVHEIAIAKTRRLYWEILDRGYELMKRERPKWKSKGEYRHKFCVHRIAHTFSQHGYRTAIEHRRPNGKLVDLRSSKDGESIYYEVCASFPVEKELLNVEGNLDGPPTPTAMYLCVTDRKMKRPLMQALQDFTNGLSLPCPVDVVLAGDLIGPLEVLR